MGRIFDEACQTYSDGPVGSPIEPSKSAIRRLFGTIDSSVKGAVAGRIDQDTWAGLSAITGTYDCQPAIVYGPDAGTHTDPVVGGTVANTGSYSWSDSSAGWRRIGGLDAAIVLATNTGAGTANAVQSTADIAFDASPGKALISVNFLADNTGPMTLTINGETPRALVTNTGAAIPSGYVHNNMHALIQIDADGNYRLFSYGDAAAHETAAETAAAAAQTALTETEAALAAAANVPQWSFANAAAAGMFNPVTDPAFIAVDGRYRLKVSGQTDYGDQVAIGSGARYRIHELSVTPEDFGAVAGVVAAGQRTVNTIAFRKWVRYLLETGRTGVCWSAYYEIDGSIYSANKTTWSGFQQPDRSGLQLKIDCVNGTTINYFGPATNYVFDLQLSAMRQAAIAGLNVDGGDLAHAGIVMVAYTDNCEALRLHYCGAKNLRIQATGPNSNGFGLRLAGDNGIRLQQAEIIGCDVQNLSKAVRAGGTLAMQAIVVNNASQIRVDENFVDGVYHDGVDKIDADGLAIFSGQDAFVYRRVAGSVDRNVLRNTAGRGIKGQFNGNVSVAGNVVDIDEAIELISSWSAFESQAGACSFVNNSLVMGDQWTGAAGGRALYMQIPTGSPTSLDKKLRLECRGLRIETRKELSRIWEIAVHSYGAEVDLILTDCTARGPGPKTSIAAGQCAADIFGVVTGVSGLSAADRINIISENADVHVRTPWIFAIGSSGLSDLTDIVTFTSTRDTYYPLSGSTQLFGSSSTTKTSSLRVSEGQWGANAVISSDINYAKLLPGFAAYIGNGTMTGGPPSSTYNFVEAGAPGRIKAYRSNLISYTENAGVTWRAVVLT